MAVVGREHNIRTVASEGSAKFFSIPGSISWDSGALGMDVCSMRASTGREQSGCHSHPWPASVKRYAVGIGL